MNYTLNNQNWHISVHIIRIRNRDFFLFELAHREKEKKEFFPWKLKYTKNTQQAKLSLTFFFLFSKKIARYTKNDIEKKAET